MTPNLKDVWNLAVDVAMWPYAAYDIWSKTDMLLDGDGVYNPDARPDLGKKFKSIIPVIGGGIGGQAILGCISPQAPEWAVVTSMLVGLFTGAAIGILVSADGMKDPPTKMQRFFPRFTAERK